LPTVTLTPTAASLSARRRGGRRITGRVRNGPRMWLAVDVACVGRIVLWAYREPRRKKGRGGKSAIGRLPQSIDEAPGRELWWSMASANALRTAIWSKGAILKPRKFPRPRPYQGLVQGDVRRFWNSRELRSWNRATSSSPASSLPTAGIAHNRFPHDLGQIALPRLVSPGWFPSAVTRPTLSG